MEWEAQPNLFQGKGSRTHYLLSEFLNVNFTNELSINSHIWLAKIANLKWENEYHQNPLIASQEAKVAFSFCLGQHQYLGSKTILFLSGSVSDAYATISFFPAPTPSGTSRKNYLYDPEPLYMNTGIMMAANKERRNP